MSPDYIKYRDMIKVLDNSISSIGSTITSIRESMSLLASNPLNRPLKEFTDEMLGLKVDLDIQEKLQSEVAEIKRKLTEESFIDLAGITKN